jgi:hypothetical protein
MDTCFTVVSFYFHKNMAFDEVSDLAGDNGSAYF